MGWGKGNELFAFDFLLVLGVERMEHVFHPLSNINCYFTDWVYLGSRTPLIEIRIMKLCDTRQFLGGSHYHLLQKHPFFSNCKCVPLFRACGKGEAQVLEIPSVFFFPHLISSRDDFLRFSLMQTQLLLVHMIVAGLFTVQWPSYKAFIFLAFLAHMLKSCS